MWAGKKNKEHLNYLLITLCGTMKQLCSWWRSKGVLGPRCWLMDWSTWHMRRVRESWNCVSRVEKALGGSCQCINTWWQREDTAGLLWVSSNRTRDNEDKLKHMKFCLNRRKLLLYGWLNTGTGYPGRSWSVPSWDIFIVSAGHNPGQPALFSIWLCFEQEGWATLSPEVIYNLSCSVILWLNI